MKALRFLKAKWQNIAIVLLLLNLLVGTALPALADAIRIQAQPALNDIADVNAAAPSDDDVLSWDNGASEWVDRAIPETFLEFPDTPSDYASQGGLSPVVNDAEDALEFAQRTQMSEGDKTIYLDKDASGANDGTSWTDAFESWADCKAYLTGWIIAHAWTVVVREATTPYRETFAISAFKVWGTLTIEAEYWWQGDCEANVGGAGEITDTGAFGDVAVGDKVFILDLNGADGRANDYELCTVDSIANEPNRIGTDGSKTPSTGWKYLIVRTELSGSDDGTDGGTVRGSIITMTAIDNVTVSGFYMTFSNAYAFQANNCRGITVGHSIMADCDRGVWVYYNCGIYLPYLPIEATDNYCIVVDYNSVVRPYYGAWNSNSIAGHVSMSSSIRPQYIYIDDAGRGVNLGIESTAYIYKCFISASVSTGVKVRQNSSAYLRYTTNNANPTPEDPAGTTEGAFIEVI